MLKSIIMQKLRNSEFIQFFTNLVTILLKYKPEELSLHKQLEPIETDLEKIKAIYGTSQASEISKELEDIDDLRDDCITGISQVVQGYTYHYSPRIKKAAEALLDKIDNYGPSIAKQNYPTETATLNSITQAFTSEQVFIDALNLLGLSDWAQRMNKYNQRFDKRYLDRVDKKSKVSDDKVKALRKTTIQSYFELRKHLDAHTTLKPEVYEPITAELNELIDKYNSVVNRRKSYDETDSEEGAEG